jgi:hypothetical protein
MFPQTMLVDWMRVYEDRAMALPAGGTVSDHGAGTAPVMPPIRVPGIVEAEHFDAGGEGVGYHDTDIENRGCAFRPGEGVDIEPCEDEGKGWDVGFTKAGEWLRYTATVTAAGRYHLDVRVASKGPGGVFHLELDGRDVTGPLTVPDTGGWVKFVTVSRNGLLLPAGCHAFRLVMDADGEAGSVGNVNRLVFELEEGRAGGHSHLAK